MSCCRRIRAPSPTPDQGHLQPGHFDGGDQGRLASPLVRCAASYGSQALTDQDADAVRKLVSRMATFAAYRACMPGGLEAVEDMERWQRKVWTAEAEEYAAFAQSQPVQPVLAGKRQQRNRGHVQPQPPTCKGSRERPASSRGKSGPAVSQQGNSRSMKALSVAHRGTGSNPMPSTSMVSESDVSAALQSGDAVAHVDTLHEDSCTTGPESCTQKGAASCYPCVCGRPPSMLLCCCFLAPRYRNMTDGPLGNSKQHLKR